MFERLITKEMEGAQLHVVEDRLFAILPDGRVVLVDAESDYGISYLTFENYTGFKESTK